MSDAIRKALKHRSNAADTVHKQRKDEVQAVQSNLIKEAKQRELEDTANRARTKSRHEEALDNLTDAIFKQMKAQEPPVRRKLFPPPDTISTIRSETDTSEEETDADYFYDPISTEPPINPRTGKPFGKASQTYKRWEARQKK